MTEEAAKVISEAIMNRSAKNETVPELLPLKKIEMYGNVADTLDGQIFSSTISTSPFLNGSINLEIAAEHSKIIELQDGLVEKQFKEFGMGNPPAQAGMISMQDDDVLKRERIVESALWHTASNISVKG
jgi:hypothetical protein